ncbi:LPD23 domain-containing protein [uncultured Dialister sp.]|uniref:LPD23 domain-containing protein n=1 Tax=Dialister sp. UBA1703 TaxID=1946415 RepID=UPI0035A989FC
MKKNKLGHRDNQFGSFNYQSGGKLIQKGFVPGRNEDPQFTGESMEEIFKETGWSVGMDGRWRF